MVWGIYIFDRIFDSFRFPLIEATPRRHLFAKKGRFVLFGLSAVAMGAAGVFILPHVSWDLVEAAIFPGILCLLYFVVFRFVKQSSENAFPAKELVIGFCFASGVMVASGARFPAPPSLMIEAALAALFAGNCLIIGWAEREYDGELDAAAFYGKNRAGLLIPKVLFSLAAVLGGLLCLSHSLPFIGGALVVCTVLQLGCRKWAGTELMQPLADGSLLFPWILLLFFG
ncbi:MAG: hypothetical protein P1U86_14830 [Verrucomicrobiales bacterium]|nr:hypothetical protein [Verrucomicrobiales bacterium]